MRLSAGRRLFENKNGNAQYRVLPFILSLSAATKAFGKSSSVAPDALARMKPH
jgi:hypothetical protein